MTEPSNTSDGASWPDRSPWSDGPPEPPTASPGFAYATPEPPTAAPGVPTQPAPPVPQVGYQPGSATGVAPTSGGLPPTSAMLLGNQPPAYPVSGPGYPPVSGPGYPVSAPG